VQNCIVRAVPLNREEEGEKGEEEEEVSGANSRNPGAECGTA